MAETARNIRWPGEFEAQEAVIIGWPIKDPNAQLDDGIPQREITTWHSRLANVIAGIRETDNVIVCVPTFTSTKKHDFKQLVDMLRRRGIDRQTIDIIDQVRPEHESLALDNDRTFHLVHEHYGSDWVRDIAPQTVFDENETRNLVCLRGSELDPPRLTKDISEMLGIHSRSIRDTLIEGGAIDGNGNGTALAAEYSMNDDCRDVLRRVLGVEKCIGLHDIVGGIHHIDLIARFAAADTILACRERESSKPSHAELESNWELLTHETLADGSTPTVIELPVPEPVEYKGHTEPASYANFAVFNNCVAVPVYGGKSRQKDQHVLQLMEQLFPGREIIEFPSRMFAAFNASIHCMTMHIPAAQE